ncbi:ATP-binding protein [Luteitalea sp.]|uniref:ATP-binding protein n=1 Tax=Luteitalea sp. TaxID=2004800 RepID=UPI0025B9A022|nr:ATP-binding protein [Luteitalea sp.]
MNAPDPFVGRSEMAARMRDFDWSRTPIGPVVSWPQSLRSALSICTGSALPIAIYWGPSLILLYNDAWSPIAGTKHPWALGRPAAEVWPELWSDIGPRFAHVLRTGDPTYLEDALLPMHRHGYTEECYFNYTFTGIRGEGGRVDGIFNAVIETTYRVVSERRTRLLQRLGEETGQVRTPAAACASAAHVLTSDGDDAPFCLVYLDAGGGTAHLVAAAGLADGSPLAPAIMALDDATTWPIGQALTGGQVVHVGNLSTRFGAVTVGHPWPEAVQDALLAPLRTGSVEGEAGVLVIGASPRRAVDEEYRQFAARAAAILSSTLASATAYQTERSRAESLVAIDRAKTVFFSNVSHEFRTPLTLMLGPTEDALASISGALTGEDLLTVHRNQLRLLKLVNALLDFSRLESGRMQAAYARTDLGQYTSDLASAFRSAFERAGLGYDVHCAPIEGDVYVDRDMWEKIVFNLLSNALKFTFEGRITVRLDDSGDHVALTVADTGVGIAEVDLPLLFERFRRVEGVRARTHEGSGIGLALVQELARLHGGDCTVASAPGHGTRVIATVRKGRMHLPQDAVRADVGPRAPAGPNAHVIEALRWIPDADGDTAPTFDSGPASSLGDDLTTAPGRVLVADDNADMRDYLARLLGRYWTVETVVDGQRALEAIARVRPDLVLTDVMMPGVDGFGLLRALRSDPATCAIPVVVLSARAGEEARIEGIESGADDYVVKPFSSRELVARVNAQMALARAARERADLLAREQAARREAELQKTHLYSLFMQAPVAIAVLRGRSYRIELANGLACAIWRRGHEEVIGRPLFDALPELREGRWQTLLDEVYASGHPHVGNEVPARFRTASGRDDDLTYLNFVYTPLLTADGEVDGMLVIATDVTSQVVAREEMRRLREAAESASRAKDEFLAMLGHELRNPLAPIRTALDLMRLRGVDAALRERQIIERQVAHLVALVDDLLDVSRITRGKLHLRRVVVETSAIVARGIEMSSPLLDQHQHELTVDVPRDGLPVLGDLERLAQVVANLLTNAAKYTEPGGRIHVEAHHRGDEIVLAVRDSGVGIDADMLPTIFDLFVQERQSLARSQGGLGLGLTIVRSLVQLHGGHVVARSAGRGQGAEFVVTLPHASDDVATAVVAEGPAGDAVPSSGLRVLVVDDNVDAAGLLAEWLSAVGHETVAVHDGPSAIAAAEAVPPDVALLDLGLPVMDGYELARRFSEHPRLRDVRLFAVTGYGQDTDRARSLASGFAEHLVKPIDVDRLVALLEQGSQA